MTFTYDSANYEATLLASAGGNIHSATADPATTSDRAHGYAVGSRWLNTSSGKLYTCTDSTAAAAVWQQVALFAADGSIAITAASTKTITLTVSGSGGAILLAGVPAADPHVANALYTSTGALKVSTG